MLLRFGAVPGTMDQEGKNALDYAQSAEFEEVVKMLSAADTTPSICASHRAMGGDSAPPMSQRGLPPGAQQENYMSTDPWDTGGPMSARAGGRMTPRVPLAGAVSGQGGLAPRAPHNGGRPP